jgi:hypothetical protein
VPGSWRSPVGWPRRRSSSRSLRAVPAGRRRSRRPDRAAPGRVAAPAGRRPGEVDRRLRAGERAADAAAAGRPADGAAVLEVRTGRHAACSAWAAWTRPDEDYRTASRSWARPHWTGWTRRQCRCAASARTVCEAISSA